MPLRDAFLFLAATAFIASPLAAQEAADAPASGASSDLTLMRSKADADPFLSDQFRQVEQMFERKNSANRQGDLRQYLFRYLGRNNLSLSEPVRIATLESLQPAQSRAQAAGQILAADLDGDWQITREELTETLKYNRVDAAASAFLLADSDGNNVLTTEEIRVAVDDLARSQFGRGQQMPSLMTVFDFDGDGMFTQAEFDRGAAALSK